MIDDTLLSTVLDAGAKRRDERRRFLKLAGTTAVTAGGLALLAACDDDDDDGTVTSPTPTPTPTPSATPTTGITDGDLLNYALNLEYLEAQFYSFAAFGTGLPPTSLTGTGTQGAVTGGRQVNFTDPLVAAYAREIAADEIAHVNFLRRAIGNTAIAQPAINISGDASGAFTAAARAAGVVTENGTFDPYASDENFLIGAYIFEDVGVTAYKGGSPLIQSATFLTAAAGILAAEAYHAGLVRTVLYAKGIATPSTNLIQAANLISNARDSLDGSSDFDQGITNGDNANLVPADGNAIVYSRTPEQVHNIVYLTRSRATSGGFFPAGTNNANAALRVSGAN